MSEESARGKFNAASIDWWTWGISGGFVLIFVIAALINIDAVTNFVNVGYAWACDYFGAFWQVLVFLTFLLSLVLALSKYGAVKLSNHKPDFTTFKWVAMIVTTLLAGGGVFFSASEPISHFLTTPPQYTGIESGTAAAAAPALAMSYLHWGYLAWAVLGSLSGILLGYLHYEKGLPLKPRTLLYPIFGEKGVKGTWGMLADAFAVIGVAAGTIGPIGFLGLQLADALNQLWGIPNIYTIQLIILVVVGIFYTVVTTTGLEKGIQHLANANVILTFVLAGFILLFGPGRFIIDQFLTAFGLYHQDFLRISLFRGAGHEWLNAWTIFYWGWFIGYAPIMGVFVARISKGRTIRQIVLAVSLIAPIVTNMWFSVLGGSGIFYELTNPGSIAGPLADRGLPACLLSIGEQLPLSTIVIPLLLLLVILFLATTGTGITYTIAMTVTGDETPDKFTRAFWCIAMCAAAAVLIKIGGVGALQNFIVITAVPCSLICVPPLWGAFKAAKKLYEIRTQGKEQPDQPGEPA
jgi:glycine betaine transporter